ncbi:MAG: FHA domain-containing protein [Pirellulaceae bacterium]
MLKAMLVVVGGDAKAAEIALNLPTTIGRGRDAGLTLPHPLVSRQHCELYEQDGMLHVRDLKSLNGTYVNSQRIEASAVLKPEQLLTIGNVTFRAVYTAGESVDESVFDPVSDEYEAQSNVIEFEEVASADADSKIDEHDGRDSIHSRPTVPGKQRTTRESFKETVHQKANPLHETVSAESIKQGRPGGSDVGGSDVIDEADAPETAPEHSVVAAMLDAGIANIGDERATLSDLHGQLPEDGPAAASNVDGLVVDEASRPASPDGEFTGVEDEEAAEDKVRPDESALGSFIRKLPR